MDVAARIAHVFIHVGEEGDHVVPHHRLDLQDPGHGEGRPLADLRHRFGWHPPQIRIGLAGGDLHLQPAAKLGLLTPEASHFGKGVAIDQGRTMVGNPTYR